MELKHLKFRHGTKVNAIGAKKRFQLPNHGILDTQHIHEAKEMSPRTFVQK
jgi:hypothetical protein